MNKNASHIALALAFSAAFAAPFAVSAATLGASMPKTAAKGEEVMVRVTIDTAGDKVNALSGSISFDPTKLEVARIYDGGSPVTLWIERPHLLQALSARRSSIDFSGIAPGGFQGKFTVFSFVARPLVSGRIDVSASGLQANKNDGQGTPISLSFDKGIPTYVSGSSDATIAASDSVPPEAFAPVVSSSADLFDGAPFVSWSAQDKGSGIERYEAAATLLLAPSDGDWKPAESPLRLDSGASYRRIYIKAVDRQGNVRISSVAGPTRYRDAAIWVIIISIALCAYHSKKRRSF